MNVNITCTPEYSFDELSQIVELLNNVPGEIKFRTNKELVTAEQFSMMVDKFESPESIKSLSFEELFKLCDCYRKIKNIPKDEFIILITSIPNEKNWFSAFENKYIFVNSEDWKYYSDRDSKFGIAYQIVENIFQSLVNLNIINIDREPNIHLKSIGCINDMCIDKSEVLFKLRTADICESCIERAEKEKLNPNVITHIIEITELIRTEFKRTRNLTKKFKLETVQIDNKSKILIGKHEIKFDTIKKSVYILFLKHLEGIHTNDIDSYHDEVLGLYLKLRKGGSLLTVERLMKPYSGLKPTFYSNKTDLNKLLVKTLGATLADYYIIDNIKGKNNINVYKIKLDFNHIIIDPKY
jgi:hypothetical protein